MLILIRNKKKSNLQPYPLSLTFFSDTIKTRQEHNAWKEWRASELERDIEYCHPRWPQEAQYVNAEIKAVRNLSLLTDSDYWIYFDWVALVFILATIVSHGIFFYYSTDLSKDIHYYITMPLLLILWLRIFKYARPFESAGPFIVIFGSVTGDILKWAFLNLVIIIPFTCAFWMTFGAVSSHPVQGYNQVGPLLYNIFSMMVVNNHGFENLESANPFMARLLCGSFIAIAAIVTLNLLIALLTNTFERLYENAIANAVMQRAETILLLQKSLRQSKKSKYYSFIKEKASPEVISKNLGRLMTMDSDEATIERVRDEVKDIKDILREQFGSKFRKGKKSDLDFVKIDVTEVRRLQEEIVIDVKNMKLWLEEIKLQREQKNETVNAAIAIMNNSDSENEEKHDSCEDGKNNSSDESDTPSEDYDEENGEKDSETDTILVNANNDNEHSNKNNKNRKSSSGKTLKGKLESKQKTKSQTGNGQKKLEKNFKCSTEMGNPETNLHVPNVEKDTGGITNEKAVFRAEGKKDKRYRKNKDYQIKDKLGRKENSQSKLFNRRFEVPFKNEEEVHGQGMAYLPQYVQTPKHKDNPDVGQQPWIYHYTKLHTPLHEAYIPDISKDRLTYTSRQSQMSTPDMWKSTEIPYESISRMSRPAAQDQNQFVYNRQKKHGSSVPSLIQNEKHSEVINVA